MLTLKQTQKILIDFFKNHMQVQAVYTFDVKGFISKRDKEYMCANIEYLDSTIVNKIMNYNFQITLSDLLLPSKENELDVYNDTLILAEDFLTYIQYHDDFNYLRNASITKFSETDGDIIAGVTFRITLQVIRSQNECQIPFKPENKFPYILPVYP